MNYGDLRSMVLDFLDIGVGDTSRVAQVEREIRQSHLQAVRRFKLKAGLAVLSTIADDARVDLPDDFMKVESLWRSGQQLFPIQRRQLAAYLSSDSVTSDGSYAYVFEAPDRIRIFPTPTATEDAALTLDYIARPVAMSADADIPEAVPEEWHMLLGWEPIASIALAEGALDVYQGAEAKAAEIRRQMQIAMSTRVGPGFPQVQIAGYRFRSRSR